MRRLPSATLALVLLAAPAAADNLSRLETASELSGQKFSAFLVSRAPELQPNLPDWTWADADRTAGSCFLASMQAAQGSGYVARYLAALEAYAAAPITSLEQTQNQPRELMEQPVMTAMQGCGVQQLVMQRMIASGLMGALMNPAMVEKLGG